MRIENVAFGRLTIGETTYTSDLCIYPDGRVVDGWWRRQGHGLCVEDIADLVARNPGPSSSAPASTAACGPRRTWRPGFGARASNCSTPPTPRPPPCSTASGGDAVWPPGST